MKSSLTIFFILIYTGIYCQSISPSVINTNGGQFSNNDFSLEWSIGEVVVTSLQSGSNILTQGFIQPNLPNSVSNIDLNDPNLLVYPNPFTNWVNIIDNNNLNQIWNIKIFNSEGKFLFEKLNVNQIDLEFLSNGLYLIYISDDKNNFIESIKITKYN